MKFSILYSHLSTKRALHAMVNWERINCHLGNVIFVLRRERENEKWESERIMRSTRCVRSRDSNWYCESHVRVECNAIPKIRKTKCIGDEWKRSSHRLIGHQSNVGRAENLAFLLVMLTDHVERKKKIEAKNERFISTATIFGTRD